MEDTSLLWPEDRDTALPGLADSAAGPNSELAVSMLANGCTQQQVKQACGFESMRAVRAFCRDSEVVAAVAEQTAQKTKTVGSRALVRLERLLAEERHSDTRALVLAIRTGLDVAGLMKREPAAPLRTVAELSVSELSHLIESTKAELNARVSAGGHTKGRPPQDV